MDDGRGSFIPIPEEIYQEKIDELDSGVFKVGEIVELRGSRFRVKAIKPTELRLKLLPRKDKEPS